MHIQLELGQSQITWRPGHFPPNITYSHEDFTLPYDCVVGPFHGDWFDAAQIYRKWALKQSWCSKGPLLTRKDTPRWYAQSPLYFYTTLEDSAEGKHSWHENLPIAVAHFQEILSWAKMKLPLNLYGWKDYTPGLTTYDVPFNLYRTQNQGRWDGLPCNNAHDGNYPKIGALPELSSLCAQLRAKGGMVCPYVALEIYDQGASENAPYVAEAKPNITRGLYGSIRMWGAETSWQPCAHTPWWRNRLKETAVLMLQRENIGGFYLDVMQGSALPCYWTPHGHSAGGGSSSTVGMHELVRIVHEAVKKQDPEAITSGENAAENMIDVIDGVLQHVLDEKTRAPIFAAVYQDYVSRYGLELSTGRPEAFFIECASLFVEGAQIGRLRLSPRSNSLSIHKPEQKPLFDFLERVIGYYKQDVANKFLAYGQLLRPLTFDKPSPMPMLIYNPGVEFAALMSGVFRSADGELGIFIVNAGSNDLAYSFHLNRAKYGLPNDATVTVDAITPDGSSRAIHNRLSGDIALSGNLKGHGIAMFKVR
jgi:hypothetical protein